MTAEDIEKVLTCLHPIVADYGKGEFLALTEEPLGGLGLVVEGRAVVLKESLSGQQVVMAQLMAGDLFGEVAAFSDNPVWPASVQAQTACTALFLAPERLAGGCERTCPWHNRLTQNMLRVLAEKGLWLNRRIEFLVMKSIRSKLSAFLLLQVKQQESQAITLPFNRTELAEFLNVSRPSMSRELGQMKREGYLDYQGRQVQVKDVAALKWMIEQ